MNFKLSIKAKGDSLKFDKSSSLVKFFVEGENLEKLVDDFFSNLNLKLNPIQKKSFLDEKNNSLTYYSQEPEPSIIFLKKIKVDKDFSTDFFRNYFAGFIGLLKSKKIKSVNVIVPAFSHFPGHFESDEYMVQTIAEGIYLGNYTFDKYKTGKKEIESVNFNLHYTDQKLVQSVISQTEKLMDAVYFTRDLVNEPAAILTPAEFANRTKHEFAKTGIKVTVFNKRELVKRKMNAILAVGGSSTNDPLMIVLHYKPKNPKMKVALVGKGVTYDKTNIRIDGNESRYGGRCACCGNNQSSCNAEIANRNYWDCTVC